MDWMRPTHIAKGNLLSSVYPFECLSHPEIPSQTLRIMLTKYLGIAWPHKINHHNVCAPKEGPLFLGNQVKVPLNYKLWLWPESFGFSVYREQTVRRGVTTLAEEISRRKKGCSSTVGAERDTYGHNPLPNHNCEHTQQP